MLVGVLEMCSCFQTTSRDEYIFLTWTVNKAVKYVHMFIHPLCHTFEKLMLHKNVVCIYIHKYVNEFKPCIHPSRRHSGGAMLI